MNLHRESVLLKVKAKCELYGLENWQKKKRFKKSLYQEEHQAALARCRGPIGYNLSAAEIYYVWNAGDWKEMTAESHTS